MVTWCSAHIQPVTEILQLSRFQTMRDLLEKEMTKIPKGSHKDWPEDEDKAWHAAYMIEHKAFLNKKGQLSQPLTKEIFFRPTIPEAATDHAKAFYLIVSNQSTMKAALNLKSVKHNIPREVTWSLNSPFYIYRYGKKYFEALIQLRPIVDARDALKAVVAAQPDERALLFLDLLDVPVEEEIHDLEDEGQVHQHKPVQKPREPRAPRKDRKGKGRAQGERMNKDGDEKASEEGTGTGWDEKEDLLIEMGGIVKEILAPLATSSNISERAETKKILQQSIAKWHDFIGVTIYHILLCGSIHY